MIEPYNSEKLVDSILDSYKKNSEKNYEISAIVSESVLKKKNLFKINEEKKEKLKKANEVKNISKKKTNICLTNPDFNDKYNEILKKNLIQKSKKDKALTMAIEPPKFKDKYNEVIKSFFYETNNDEENTDYKLNIYEENFKINDNDDEKVFFLKNILKK